MAFIPKGAVWYIAEIVLEIIVEDDPRNVVHINYMLIKADSPEEAYNRALHLGAEHESTYANADAKGVQIFFRGLQNLNVVYEELEDGAELLYEEKISVSQEQLSGLVRAKESLGVFTAIERSPGPNYASGDIQREAMKIVERDKSDAKKMVHDD